MPGGSRLAELAGELDRLGEALTDAAMDVLREAAYGEEADKAEATKREKVINRARAAVERAAHLLRQADPGSAAEDW